MFLSLRESRTLSTSLHLSLILLELRILLLGHWTNYLLLRTVPLIWLPIKRHKCQGSGQGSQNSWLVQSAHSRGGDKAVSQRDSTSLHLTTLWAHTSHINWVLSFDLSSMFEKSKEAALLIASFIVCLQRFRLSSFFIAMFSVVLFMCACTGAPVCVPLAYQFLHLSNFLNAYHHTRLSSMTTKTTKTNLTT